MGKFATIVTSPQCGFVSWVIGESLLLWASIWTSGCPIRQINAREFAYLTNKSGCTGGGAG